MLKKFPNISHSGQFQSGIISTRDCVYDQLQYNISEDARGVDLDV